MDPLAARAFRLKAQGDAELRQKLKDTDLLPHDLRAVAVVFIARDEGFTLGALDTEEVLASLTTAGMTAETEPTGRYTAPPR